MSLRTAVGAARTARPCRARLASAAKPAAASSVRRREARIDRTDACSVVRGWSRADRRPSSLHAGDAPHRPRPPPPASAPLLVVLTTDNHAPRPDHVPKSHALPTLLHDLSLTLSSTRCFQARCPHSFTPTISRLSQCTFVLSHPIALCTECDSTPRLELALVPAALPSDFAAPLSTSWRAADEHRRASTIQSAPSDCVSS